MEGHDPFPIMTYLHQLILISMIWYGLATAQTTAPTDPQSCPSGCHCDFQTRVVNCQQGSFTSIPNTFPSYTATLILRGNIFRTLLEDSFIGLSNLVSLDLTSCEIGTINPRAFNGLDNLHILNLQLNHLSTLPPGAFAGLTKLRELNLERNKLQILPGGVLSDTQVLKVLDVNDNRITQIHDDAFSDSSVLSALHLAYNQLVSIPEMALKNLTNLKNLALSGNPIPTIPSRTFISLTSLNLLYLDNMQLGSLESTLEVDSFAGLQSVTTIDLSNNQFRTLDPLAFQSLTSLDTLILTGNSWDCECPLSPFVQWLKQSGISYYSTSWFCIYPSDLSGTVVYALEPRDFACEPIITDPPIDTVVEYRQRVIFQCGAKGDPTPEIKWYGPDGTRILATSNEENVYTTLDGIVLVIRSAEEEHVGLYNCTASNVRGSDSVVFQVVVNGIPEPEVSTVSGSTVSDNSSTPVVEPTDTTCASFTLSIVMASVNESSIEVSWIPFNGDREITGYIVQSHIFGEQQTNSYYVNWTASSFELTNLLSNTGYTVCAAFLLDNCPLVIPRAQCTEVTTAGVNPATAALQGRHRNEIVGTALACILGTLLLMATIFFILWRYRKPKDYHHYDFKGNKDTAAFAGIPEDNGFTVSDVIASGSVSSNKYEAQNGAYVNGGMDISTGNSNEYSNEPVGGSVIYENSVIQHSADIHSDVEPPADYTSDVTTASMKSANSVGSDDGLREGREPKDKPSKVKKSRTSLTSDESLESDEAIEMTNLGAPPHSNGDLNIENEVSVI